MKKTLQYCLIILILSGGCTTEIKVDIPDPEMEIVVEGYIENGTPPYITLSRNSPYFGGIGFNDLESYFVHDAKILVYSEGDTIQLEEYCLGLLPSQVKKLVRNFFSYENDTLDLCIYTVSDILSFISGDSIDCSVAFCGRIGRRYGLYIEAEGKTLTSTTSIPSTFTFDSLSWRPHPDPENDSLVIVDVHLSFPDTLGNYVRYFTKRNSEPFYAPQSLSVYNDRLFVGSTISLPLERGQASFEDIDIDTYGYFWREDTVTLRWMNIGKAHYDFWNTLENDGGDNPFSSPVIIKSNIEGGLGVWGGYNITYGTIILPE